MENNLKTILYVTVNTVNNKIYVGIHITKDPYKFDNYWGCGITGTGSFHFKHPKTPFQRACKKYGLNAFKRYTLFVFDTYEEAQEMEKTIVNNDFIKRTDTYNVAIGGGEGRVPEVEIETHKYDLNGNYIETYVSKSEAARQNGVTYPSIMTAMLTKCVCAGFYWSETKVMKLDLSEFNKRKEKTVYLYDKLGNFYKEFSSAVECAKFLDIHASCVQAAIKNMTRCAGYNASFEKFDKFPKREYKRKTHHPVYQYDKEGNFMAEFKDLETARKEIGLPLKTCAHKIKSKSICDGYFWSYDKLDKFEIPNKDQRKKIVQKDLDGNVVKIWDTLRECTKNFANVRYVLKGLRAQTKGFTFEYLN